MRAYWRFCVACLGFLGGGVVVEFFSVGSFLGFLLYFFTLSK